MSALKSHVQKIEFRAAGIAAKGEDKGGSITGQFSKIGQNRGKLCKNRGKLGKTEREQLFISLLCCMSASTSTDN